MVAARPKLEVCTKPRTWFRYGCAVSHAHSRSAVTLVELLLTLAVLAILAGVLIPQLSGDIPERLSAGSQILSADLDYARSLAVSNNHYDLRHSGANTVFNTLPRSPFRQTDDPVNLQTTKLSKLPLPEPGVRLAAVVQMAGTPVSAMTLEFNVLGGTVSTSTTVIWLSCGRGNLKRYCSVHVDPITGLVSIGPTVTSLPSAINSIAEAANGATQATPQGTGN
jgi:Tfp pilus assembly protein FimT